MPEARPPSRFPEGGFLQPNVFGADSNGCIEGRQNHSDYVAQQEDHILCTGQSFHCDRAVPLGAWSKCKLANRPVHIALRDEYVLLLLLLPSHNKHFRQDYTPLALCRNGAMLLSGIGSLTRNIHETASMMYLPTMVVLAIDRSHRFVMRTIKPERHTLFFLPMRTPDQRSNPMSLPARSSLVVPCQKGLRSEVSIVLRSSTTRHL